jgi:hypothetical protein
MTFKVAPLGDHEMAPLADHRLAPLRRSWGGAIKAITEWLHSGDHQHQIHLNAIYRARKVADSREDRKVYTRILEQELRKSEGEIQRIRGMAANRESRRVENF